MKRFLASVLMFVLLALSISAGSIRVPKGFDGKVYASTLALYGTKDGQTHFMCTAEPFEKISGGYHLVSAGHCVQLSPADVSFSVADYIGGPRTPVTMMKVYLGDGLDFSEFEFKTKKNYFVLAIGDEHNARVGDRIINGNFAAGVVKQVSYGFISSDILSISEHCTTEDNCAGDFLTQIYGAGGSSGSAIISERTHEVIGLVVFSFEAGNIGLGIEPISVFRKFLAGPTQPHPTDQCRGIMIGDICIEDTPQ